MESVALEWNGELQRSALEAAIRRLCQEQGIVRVKGRLWLRGKDRPLVLQAVGPRLESWFEPAAEPRGPGVELVLLGFGLDRERLEQALVQRP